MQYCIFAHTEDNKPKPREKPWKTLARGLTQHKVTDVDKNKKGRVEISLLSFVTYKENTLRAKHNIETVNAAALDIDYITADDWENIRASLEKSRVASFWYTTYSHRLQDRPDNFKIRLIIKLSRPVTGQEWAQIFPTFKNLFNADQNASDASRMFFGAFIPPGSEALHFSGIQEGDPFDVSLLLTHKTNSQLAPDALPPPPSQIVTKKMLTLLANKLARRSNAHAQLSSQMLKHFRDGEAFTEEGHRDEAVFRYIIAEIVREWSGLDVDKLTLLATPSLEASGGVSPDQFRYKLERAKKRRQEDLEKWAHEKKEKHKRSLAQANLNRQMVGVDSYYVTEALPSLDVEAMTSGRKFDIPIQQAKIVQHGGDFYFWCNGTYIGPSQRNAFIPAAVKYLSPFEEIEKELFDTSGNLKDINVDNFMTHHGRFVDEVIFALGSKKTSLTKDSLILPYYPPLTPVAAYSWRVDLWLRFLFGGTADPVGEAAARVEWAYRWLYHYRNHDLLLPALLLVGKTSAGKGLFAEFLSQAYEIPAHVAPLNLLYAPGTENDVYPVMVADEEFPKCSSAQLREGITAKTHILKKKYKNIRKVQGYIRHIFILNDADRIKTFDVGTEAQRATSERFMFVPVTEECRIYLETLCKNNEHLQPGELQSHIAWMQEQEIDKGRFAVAVPEDNQFFHESYYREKKRFAVLNVICDFVCKGSYPIGFKDRYKGWPIQVIDGQIRIKSRPFAEYCSDKVDDSKSAISRVIKSMSEPVKTRSERYWLMSPKHLYRWADIAMEYSDEEIEENMQQNTEAKVDSAANIENKALN